MNQAPFADAKFIDTYNFLKFYTNHQEGEKTGRVIVLHDLTFPVCVIDIDFEDQTEEYKDTFISKLLPALPKNTVVVQTAHKGVHIYAKHKLYLRLNRYVKIQKSETFDLDFFVNGMPEKKSCLVCPPTRVHDKKTGEELQYKFILNNYNVPDLPELDEVVSVVETLIDLTQFKEFINKHRDPPLPPPPHVDPPFVNREMMDVIVDGIKDFEITDDDTPIESGLTIKYLFEALNSMIDVRDVTKEDIDRYYHQVFENNKMNDDVRNHFFERREEMKNEKSKWNLAAKILKIHRKEYNKKFIIPLSKNMKPK